MTFKICLLSVISGLFLTFSFSSVAQDDWKLYPPKKGGNAEQFANDSSKSTQPINWIDDTERATELLDKTVERDAKKGGVEGYRVQIYFGSGYGSKQKAIAVQSEFIQAFPDVPCYLLYQSPNFKVRVGDFRSKIEAEKTKDMIKEQFPNAFIAKDLIKLPPLPLAENPKD